MSSNDSAHANTPPAGFLIIAGGVAEGSALGVISTISDADGMGPLHLQWLRNGEAIQGETFALYVPRHGDLGAFISLEASYTDGGGTHETVRAAAIPITDSGFPTPWTGLGQVMAGTDGNDRLLGYGLIDFFLGSPGNDTLDGGAGLDTAVYTAPSTQFDVNRTASGFAIADRAGSGGTDQLVNVERAVFGDTALALDIDGAAGMGFRLYQAIFDRAPDDAGMGYWLYELDQGTPLEEVAQAFMDSAEFAALYGRQPDSMAFLTALYRNALHREPDAAGIAWWNNALETGAVSEVDVLIQFSESAENQAQVIGSVEHGIHYTPWH
jgi:Ca2+-binding RTX toxin-like protein